MLLKLLKCHMLLLPPPSPTPCPDGPAHARSIYLHVQETCHTLWHYFHKSKKTPHTSNEKLASIAVEIVDKEYKKRVCP